MSIEQQVVLGFLSSTAVTLSNVAKRTLELYPRKSDQLNKRCALRVIKITRQNAKRTII